LDGGESTDAGGGSTEGVRTARTQYGQSTDPQHPQHT